MASEEKKNVLELLSKSLDLSQFEKTWMPSTAYTQKIHLQCDQSGALMQGSLWKNDKSRCAMLMDSCSKETIKSKRCFKQVFSWRVSTFLQSGQVILVFP